jgi:DNA-binding transcriptional LysR family regulator
MPFSDNLMRADAPSVRELQALRAMIESRKLIAAAARLGVTQSAVSRTINSLEERVGYSLFERSGGRLQPKPAAFSLNEAAQDVFAAIDKLSKWPAAQSEGQQLRIVTTPTNAQHVIPRLVAAFKAKESDCLVTIDIMTGVQAMNMMAENGADIGIADAFVAHQGVRIEIFRETTLHALMPLDHLLAGDAPIEPRDLDGVPLIVQTRRFRSRQEIEDAFQQAGVTPLIASEAVTSGFAAELMLCGVGVALVAAFPITAGINRGRFCARPFVPVSRHRTALVFPSVGHIRPVARRFADIVHATPFYDPCSTAV